MTAAGALGPYIEWWKGVQSWRNPFLSAFVATCVVAAAIYPSRAFALWFLFLAVRLWQYRVTVLGRTCGTPPAMLDDPTDGPSQTGGTGKGGTETAGGPGRCVGGTCGCCPSYYSY